MQPTRRDFLRLGLGGSTLLACGASVPTFLARSAAVLADQPARAAGNRVLVVLQLDGGNDGLNTVVPHRDDVYRRSRPRLALPAQGLHRLNDDLGLHPALVGLMRLHENRQLAVVQSVGYPNPNRSHFESMAIWHTARPDPNRATPGWLARCLDGRGDVPGGDTPALHISESLLPQALHGSQRHVPSLASLGTSIYYTQIGGFDTHANQLNAHANLMREVGDSLRAFFNDLQQAGQADRVLLLAFTEFGRRLHENASAGTDHGTAAPVFLV